MNNYIFDNQTDNESYSAEDETDYEDDNEEPITYEPDEPTETKFNIVLCQRYNKSLHGPAPKTLNNHYITYLRFKQLDMDFINFYNMNLNVLQLEIAECIYLPTLHCIAIIKTIWLKLIQRKWKHICKERKMCLIRRANPNALKYREIYGTWPNNCTNYPQLKGMLCNLARCSSGSSA
jgi:hypothetical protein